MNIKKKELYFEHLIYLKISWNNMIKIRFSQDDGHIDRTFIIEVYSNIWKYL